MPPNTRFARLPKRSSRQSAVTRTTHGNGVIKPTATAANIARWAHNTPGRPWRTGSRSPRQAASSIQIPHLRRIFARRQRATDSSKVARPAESTSRAGAGHRLPSLKARCPAVWRHRHDDDFERAQPISCSMSTGRRLAPLAPRLSLRAAMDDRPVSLPITRRRPTAHAYQVPRKIASNEPDRPKQGQQRAVCRTISRCRGRTTGKTIAAPKTLCQQAPRCPGNSAGLSVQGFISEGICCWGDSIAGKPSHTFKNVERACPR